MDTIIKIMCDNDSPLQQKLRSVGKWVARQGAVVHLVVIALLCAFVPLAISYRHGDRGNFQGWMSEYDSDTISLPKDQAAANKAWWEYSQTFLGKGTAASNREGVGKMPTTLISILIDHLSKFGNFRGM